MAFAEELKDLRTEAGFRTAAELSHHMSDLGYEVSYYELRRYERGEYLPTLLAFSAIADSLGLTQKEIVRLVRSVQPGSSRSKIPTAETTSEAGVAQPPIATPADT
jgi:hypothetical protein